MSVRADITKRSHKLSHTLSKTDLDHRAKQLNPINPQYYRDRGYASASDVAAKLATLEQQRCQIEAAHLKQQQKREHD